MQVMAQRQEWGGPWQTCDEEVGYHGVWYGPTSRSPSPEPLSEISDDSDMEEVPREPKPKQPRTHAKSNLSRRIAKPVASGSASSSELVTDMDKEILGELYALAALPETPTEEEWDAFCTLVSFSISVQLHS